MPDWIAFATGKFELYVLVFARVFSILATVPFFGTTQIPAQMKIGLSYFLVLILFPLIPLPHSVPGGLFYFLLVGKEVVLGLIIGYVSTILFFAVQLGWDIVDLQMGFGIVNVINPVSNIQVSLMSEFQYLMAVLLFVVMNGHYYLLLALSESFRILPLGQMHMNVHAFNTVNGFLSRMFVVAVELSLPSMAALLVTNIALGYLSRMVPQMNVFFIGFALTLFIGFIVIYITFSGAVFAYDRMFHEMIQEVMTMFKVLR